MKLIVKFEIKIIKHVSLLLVEESRSQGVKKSSRPESKGYARDLCFSPCLLDFSTPQLLDS